MNFVFCISNCILLIANNCCSCINPLCQSRNKMGAVGEKTSDNVGSLSTFLSSSYKSPTSRPVRQLVCQLGEIFIDSPLLDVHTDYGLWIANCQTKLDKYFKK